MDASAENEVVVFYSKHLLIPNIKYKYKQVNTMESNNEI